MKYEDLTDELKEHYRELHPSADEVYREAFCKYNVDSHWYTDKGYRHVDNPEILLIVD
jgi:hypothetical protein